MCYRYTNPLSAIASKRIYNYMQFLQKVKQNFYFFHFSSASEDLTQIGQRVNLKIRPQLGVIFLVRGIEPAGGNAGIFAAEDIAGQAVADDQGGCGVKVRNVGKAVVKVCLLRLMVTRDLRDEDLLEIMPALSSREYCVSATPLEAR